MPRAAKRQYLPLTDSDVVQIVAMLNAGQLGKHIAVQMCTSEAQVSAIGKGKAFRHLGLRSTKHVGHPPRAPLGPRERKPILWRMCHADFLYGRSNNAQSPTLISQNEAQRIVTGKPGQSHPAMRRVTLQAMRSCERLIDRVKASVSAPDANGCRKWTGPMDRQGPPTPIGYLGGEAVDARRIILALNGRTIRKFERLAFTCPDGNADGRCVEPSHCVSRKKAAKHATTN